MCTKFLRLSQIFLIGLIFLLIAACEVGPSYAPPETYSPESWKHQHSQDSDAESVCHWWDVFNDETLNALIQKALENNHDLYAAIERVVQARAIAGIARADLFPQITLNPLYSDEIYLTKAYAANLVSSNTNITSANIPLFREHLLDYALPVNLSWEIDLWGLLRNLYKSAIYSAQAQMEAFRETLLLLTTDLADSYFRMRTFDKQIDLYLSTIVTRKKALEINQSRYESKIANYEAVSQAALDLANVEADYYEAIRERDREENRIATLIGMPASELDLDHNPLIQEPPQIPSGVPSDVLLQRPDIAQAERERASQHARVRVAYASFLPSFSITGALGFSSPDLRHFLSWRSRLWEVGASALQTVIDGGRKISDLKLEWARFREADQNYQQQVLQAFQEVEDALTDVESFYKESEKLILSVNASSTTYKIVMDRYLQGLIFYLAVVDSERDMLNAQRNYNTVQGQRFSATIQLIKALGGSWTQDSE